MKKLILVVAVLTMLGAVAAQADTSVQTGQTPNNYIGTYTQSQLEQANWDSTWTINQFDPSLGTLKGIEIDIYAKISAPLDVTSTNEATTSISFKFGEDVYVEPVGGDPGNFYVDAEPHYTVTSQSFAPEQNINYGTVNGSANDSVIKTTSSGDWATFSSTFIGNGTLKLPVQSQGYTQVSGGTLDFSNTVYSGASYAITYTYDEAPKGGTPELGTFALMGISMLPMAGFAIRRRRRSA